MNIKLAQQKNDTLLTIEADFDKFVAENFGDICQALAKHVRILTELRDLQRRKDVKEDDIIATVRKAKSTQDAENLCCLLFTISPDTARFILNKSLSEMQDLVVYDKLQQMIKHRKHDFQILNEIFTN